MSRPTLEITTMIGCPLMCTFCPQESLRDQYGKEDDKYMSLDTFKLIVDQLPARYRLDFSGMAEPWVNPACTDMFEYGLSKGFQMAIFTTLYDWDETTVHRMGELLIAHAPQVEIFKVHFPDALGNMKGWKLTPEWEYAYIGMREIVQHAGIHYEAMTMSNDGVHPSLYRLPGVGVSHSWIGHDRAGTLPEQQVKEQALQRSPRFSVPIKCNKMPNYDQHVVLPNGDVVLCCMDYDMKHVIGNLKEKTMDEIRRDEPYKQILAENAQNAFSNNSLCRTCTEAAPR